MEAYLTGGGGGGGGGREGATSLMRLNGIPVMAGFSNEVPLYHIRISWNEFEKYAVCFSVRRFIPVCLFLFE